MMGPVTCATRHGQNQRCTTVVSIAKETMIARRSHQSLTGGEWRAFSKAGDPFLKFRASEVPGWLTFTAGQRTSPPRILVH
jgi:hypothetical protein